MTKDSYQRQAPVEYTACDEFGRMTCAEILRHAQQISMEHCEVLGIGEEYMNRVHHAFLLSKLTVFIHRQPTGGEMMIERTRAFQPDRVIYRRASDFRTTAGEVLVEVDSRWVLVNTETRRIARALPDDQVFPFLSEERVPDIVLMPESEWTPAGSVRAGWSLMDENHHVNNARYADLVTDLLGDALSAGACIREMTISYHREIRCGAEIGMFVRHSAGELRVQGRVDDAVCFDARCRYQPK